MHFNFYTFILLMIPVSMVIIGMGYHLLVFTPLCNKYYVEHIGLIHPRRIKGVSIMLCGSALILFICWLVGNVSILNALIFTASLIVASSATSHAIAFRPTERFESYGADVGSFMVQVLKWIQPCMSKASRFADLGHGEKLHYAFCSRRTGIVELIKSFFALHAQIWALIQETVSSRAHATEKTAPRIVLEKKSGSWLTLFSGAQSEMMHEVVFILRIKFGFMDAIYFRLGVKRLTPASTSCDGCGHGHHGHGPILGTQSTLPRSNQVKEAGVCGTTKFAPILFVYSTSVPSEPV